MRRNHNRQRSFHRVAAAILGLVTLGLSAPAHAGNTAEGVSNQSQATNLSRKEAVTHRVTPVRPMARRNAFGGFSGDANPYKVGRKGHMNQRQLRKHLRQNPSQRKKYGK